MSKWKHTPGEWAIHPHNSGTVVEAIHSIRGRRIVATSTADDDDEARANARLIAAAPELATAVRMLIQTIGQFAPYDPDVAEGVVAVVGVAHDALVKAGVES